MRTLVLAKTIIFNSDGKLLVLRRSDDDEQRPGGSDFPGGNVEAGETITKGAIREAEEESGLRLKFTDMHLVFANNRVDYPKNGKADVNIVWLGFVTKIAGGQSVRLSFEHKRFDWFTLEEALEDCDAPTQKLFLTLIRDHDILSQYWP